MKIKTEVKKIVIYTEEKLSIDNSAAFMEELKAVIDENPGIMLEIDAERLTYISSSGLRVILSILRKCSGNLTVFNVSDEIYEILEVTGFTEMMEVKKKSDLIPEEICEIA